MNTDNPSIESLATFLSLCQTTVARDDEKTKNDLASRAEEIVDVLELDLRGHITLDGRHPLVEACRSGNMKIVEMFVDSGANLNFVDSDGRSPLYAAIVGRNCSLQDIKQILHWGADVNLHRDGKLPLFASLYCMGTEVSQLLISEGADVNNVILTCFCFIESVFALNSTLVMVMSGFQLQHDDLPAMVSLAQDIVLAGLLPKTFYLTSGRRHVVRGASQRYHLEEESLMTAELAMLWRLQHLCLSLGFKVDLPCLEGSIAEVRQQLELEEASVPTDQVLIARADESVAGVSNFPRTFHKFDMFFESHAGEQLESSTAQYNLTEVNTVDDKSAHESGASAEETDGSSNSDSKVESQRVVVLKNKLSQLLWIQHFQASPMPLTYLARISLRAHLSQPAISRGKHIENAIDVLPMPTMFKDFLALKDYRKGMDAFL